MITSLLRPRTNLGQSVLEMSHYNLWFLHPGLAIISCKVKYV